MQMWKLLRAGTEPGADSRRTMRWERLGEVLRELDELRERGEAVRLPDAQGSGVEGSAVESGGGDTEGPQGEPLDEGVDRATS